jgi:PAS domain S-box-containing protein
VAAGDNSLTLDSHLKRIEQYIREVGIERTPPARSPARDRLARFLREASPRLLDAWVQDIGQALNLAPAEWPGLRADQASAVERWARHIEDPSNVETYTFLLSHTRRGFIGQFPASRFLATQMRFAQLAQEALAAEPDARDLRSLLANEFAKRILHVTDFFVEARQAELLEQEASYRRLIEFAPAGIVMTDALDGRIYAVNATANQLLGFEAEALVGRYLTDLHPPEEHAAVDLLWQTTLAQGHASRDGLHLIAKDGRSIAVLATAGSIEYADRHRITVIYGDVSEREQLEGQLVQSEKMAAIGQLAAGIAHELRNPLAIVMNVLYDLRALVHTDQAEIREDFRIAEEEIGRAQAIIKNLLEFSRESGVELEQVDINDFVGRTLELMQKYMEDNGVQVTVDLQPIPTCVANSNAIRQILLNLITNAVQAMPSGGTLVMRTHRNRFDRVRLEVQDTGIGIPKHHLNDIFNPFFTTKAPGQGTGLGLSVVHSIVKRFRGEIHVTSELGVGTTFAVELPCPCHDIAQP